MTLPITINFDAVNAVISVSSAGNTQEVQLEIDMLKIDQQPDIQVTNYAEERCRLLGDNIFHTDAKTLLTAFVQGFSSEGYFQDSIERVTGSPESKPIIYFAPAIFIRRRTQRNLFAACESIIKQINKPDFEIPASLRKVIGELGVDDQTESVKDKSINDKIYSEDRKIYFPLLYNDEQKRILKLLSQQTGVLVQGPPGTGKSQTIANLICHLLAKGKRILVTSQKAPALRVLKNMLPDAVADLCVMVLGEGPEEQQELQKSVGEISSRYSNWSEDYSQKTINDLNNKIDKLEIAEAKSFESFCAIREKEIFINGPLFGDYTGTLADIACRVYKEADRFSWFKDRLDKDICLLDKPAPVLPIGGDKVSRFIKLCRKIKPNIEKRCRMDLIEMDSIPSGENFLNIVNQENEAKKAYLEGADQRNHPAYKILSKIDANHLKIFLADLQDFSSDLQGVFNSGVEWYYNATQEILKRNKAAWTALFESGNILLESIRLKIKNCADFEITGLRERSNIVVLQDTKDLIEHLNNGGKFGFLFFRPKPVKNSLYIINEIFINGRLCRDKESLSSLLEWLELSEAIRKLKEQWNFKTIICDENLPLNQMYCQYEEAHAKLDKLFQLCKKADELEDKLNSWDKGLHVDWANLDDLAFFGNLISWILKERYLNTVTAKFDEILKRINLQCLKPESAPENRALYNSVERRNIAEYVKVYDILKKLWKFKYACEERNELCKEINKNFHTLLLDIKDSFNDSSWDSRIADLSSAWFWVCADTWLLQMADPEMEEELSRKIKEYRLEKRKCVGKLSAEYAWAHCMRKMTEENYQSLIAWRKAIGRIGKGTGKYAERNRKVSRQRLEECRNAIPAWVMPIYKVLDTVTIAPGIFDVVIIDEASQSGADALFLSFLGKKIVVVGDDQQIRPDYVGIDHNDVFQLQKRYLKEIPKYDIFGPTESLFSISEVRFGHPVRLREHFRCMPEIIGFSNSLCYKDQPLIPLRQFGRDRLSPVLQTKYIDGGYQESRKINPVEADAIVDEIERCCEDPTYEGKSFGVISLLHSSNQDREIEQKLIKRLDADEIVSRNIVCGDSYDFQGDERNVIFLSMVSARAENGRIGTMADEKAKRRFNVAVSRAKDQLILFHSLQENELGQNCLRRKLLNYMKQPSVDPTVLHSKIENIGQLQKLAKSLKRNMEEPPSPFDSWFEVDVFLDIIGKGYTVIPQYEVHGYRIDLVILGGSRKIAVECDGDKWHGPEQYENDIRRQRQLERCGWEFCRIRGSNYYRNPKDALTKVWEMVFTESSENFKQQNDETNSEGQSTKNNDKENENERSGFRGYQYSDSGENKVDNQIEHQDKKISQADSDKFINLDNILTMTNRQLGRVICDILENCPNHTIKKEDLTKKVCKHFNIITRGRPRQKLKTKINWALGSLKSSKRVEEYKAKNLRVRLLVPNRQLYFS